MVGRSSGLVTPLAQRLMKVTMPFRTSTHGALFESSTPVETDGPSLILEEEDDVEVTRVEAREEHAFPLEFQQDIDEQQLALDENHMKEAIEVALSG